MNRRTALRSVSVVGVGLVAGCSTQTELFATPPQLLAVGVYNRGDESQTIQVKVQDGDTTLLEERATLGTEAEGYEDTYYRHRSSEWGTISEYTYSLRLNEKPWQQLDPSNSDLDSKDRCAILGVEIGSLSEPYSYFAPVSCDYELTAETK